MAVVDNETRAKQAIFRRDLAEINKIEIMDEDMEPEVKSKILGGATVPLFLIKVSKSYYQRVEQYTKQFMGRVTQERRMSRGENKKEGEGDLMNLQGGGKRFLQ